jgi:ubiquinone/menaquinone biosynthesis C-methylase UbiE
MDRKKHWEQVYSTKEPNSVSWFQEHAEQSLRLIHATDLGTDAAIIDIGGGASTLVDDLVREAYRDITVLDLSASALVMARQRTGERAKDIEWIEGDITEVQLPAARFDIWHDRAVFHFLTEADSRRRYVEQVMHAVRPGGHIIIATFAENGPEKCSGLPVMRYSPTALHAEFGNDFELLSHEQEVHSTPFGTTQQFIYCYCRLGNS